MINITILAFCFSAGSEKHFASSCTTELLYHDNTMGDKLQYSCIVKQLYCKPNHPSTTDGTLLDILDSFQVSVTLF